MQETNVRRLDHLNLTVTDLPTTIEFYQRMFGFNPVEQGVQNGQRWAILRGGDALLCIYECSDRHAATDEETARYRLHAVNHIGLQIVDRVAWERTVEREHVVFSYPSPVDWPHSTAWYLLDPSGYEIEVAYWHQGEPVFGPS